MRVLSNRLFKTYSRLDGTKFHGMLSTTPIAGAKDKIPYRVLTVKKPCRVKNGDLVWVPGGGMILLMDQPNDHSWAVSFKAQYINQEHSWKRPGRVLDPVAKVYKEQGFEDLGTIYCMFDSPADLDLAGMSDTSYRFLTGQDVRVGDVVGDKIVKKVVTNLGVKFVHAE